MVSDGDKLSIYVFTAQTWPLTPGLFAWVKIVKLEHECMNGKFLVSVSACTFQAPLVHHYILARNYSSYINSNGCNILTNQNTQDFIQKFHD